MRQGGTITPVDPWIQLDGRLNAPAGPAQYPHLLDLNSPGTQTFGRTYVVRPPWKVSGVNYAVGIDRNLYPTDASLSDPFPSGLGGGLASALVSQGGAFNGTSIVTFTSDNQVIQGWDFSLHNGVSVAVGNGSSGNNVTIKNCKFGIGTNNATNSPVLVGVDNTVVNTTIEYNNIDGNQSLSLAGTGLAGFALVESNGYSNGTNGVLIQYNWIKYACAELLNLSTPVPPFGGTGPVTNYLVQYNIIQDAGLGEGATSGNIHGDWCQAASQVGASPGPYPLQFITFKFNLFMQTLAGPPAAGQQGADTQGITFAPLGTGFEVDNATYNNNVVISLPNALLTQFVGIDVSYEKNNSVQQNYCDLTGGSPPLILQTNQGGPFSGTIAKSGNLSLLDGSTL